MNELFFVCLYLNAFIDDSIHSSYPISLIWSTSAVHDHVPHLLWTLMGLTWSQLFTIITFPIMAGKQIINIVQFWKASKIVCVNFLGLGVQTDGGVAGGRGSG
jgi:CDP-diacylglycerol--inositol 3-phosphatidyltransferase